jgi:hypothetical protein
MLLSYRRNFLFIAAHKTGSQTVEATLRRYAEFAITSTQLGKHLSYQRIATNLSFVFTIAKRPIDSFFKFGVVREPASWLLSRYNYSNRFSTHSQAELRSLSTFADFAAARIQQYKRIESEGQVGWCQSAFFVNATGQLAADYLIDIKQLDSELHLLLATMNPPGSTRLPAPRKPVGAGAQDTIRARNISPALIQREQLTSALADEINSAFKQDAALYAMAANREFGSISQAIQRKADHVDVPIGARADR